MNVGSICNVFDENMCFANEIGADGALDLVSRLPSSMDSYAWKSSSDVSIDRAVVTPIKVLAIGKHNEFSRVPSP